jgi:hypothetical protein
LTGLFVVCPQIAKMHRLHLMLLDSKDVEVQLLALVRILEMTWQL